MKYLLLMLILLFSLKSKEMISLLIITELCLVTFLFLFFNLSSTMMNMVVIFFVCSSIIMFILVLNSVRSFNKHNSNLFLF